MNASACSATVAPRCGCASQPVVGDVISPCCVGAPTDLSPGFSCRRSPTTSQRRTLRDETGLTGRFAPQRKGAKRVGIASICDAMHRFPLDVLRGRGRILVGARAPFNVTNVDQLGLARSLARTGNTPCNTPLPIRESACVQYLGQSMVHLYAASGRGRALWRCSLVRKRS